MGPLPWYSCLGKKPFFKKNNWTILINHKKVQDEFNWFLLEPLDYLLSRCLLIIICRLALYQHEICRSRNSYSDWLKIELEVLTVILLLCCRWEPDKLNLSECGTLQRNRKLSLQGSPPKLLCDKMHLSLLSPSMINDFISTQPTALQQI